MEELPFKVPLMRISLTEEEASGRKRKLRCSSQKLRERFIEKVDLHRIKYEFDTSTPKSAPKTAFI